VTKESHVRFIINAPFISVWEQALIVRNYRKEPGIRIGTKPSLL